MGKCTKAEKERRLTEIIELIIRGYETKEIFHYITEKGWSIKHDMLDKYMAEANEYLVTCSKIDRDKETGRMFKRLVHLYQKALSKNDIAIARLVLKDLRDMFGLDAPKSLEITDKVINIMVLYGSEGKAERTTLEAGGLHQLQGKAEGDSGR